MDPPLPPPARCLAEDVLGDAGLASVVLQHLTLAEVAPLRELSRAVRDAIAAVPFGAADTRLSDVDDCAARDDDSPRWISASLRNGMVHDHLNLARWRACFPAAHALAYSDGVLLRAKPLGKAELRALNGLTTLHLSAISPQTAEAALDARVLGGVTSLALSKCFLDKVSFLRHVSPRLAAVSITRCFTRAPAPFGEMFPIFRRALAWLAHVPRVELDIDDEIGQFMTDTGIAYLVGARSLRLTIGSMKGPLAAAAFEPLRNLVSLHLRFTDDMPPHHPGLLAHAGSRLRYVSLDARGTLPSIRASIPDDLLAPLVGLRVLRLAGVWDSATLLRHLPVDAPLERLIVDDLADVSCQELISSAPQMRSLEARSCRRFHGATMPFAVGSALSTALEQLTVTDCDVFGSYELTILIARCPRMRRVALSGLVETWGCVGRRFLTFDPTAVEDDLRWQSSRGRGGTWRCTFDRKGKQFEWTATRTA
jgi:hypothetical protein